jgi:hypothetical protein
MTADQEVIMVLKIWRGITLILTALVTGTTFGHTLEMPAKLKVDGQQWMTFQHTLYPAFASIGGPIEIGAILTSAVLSFLVRKRRPTFRLTLAGTLCLLVAFAVVWLGLVAPVNAQTATWTAETIPPDWARWRRQWEYGHTTRFALHLAGLVLLTSAALSETPIDDSKATANTSGYDSRRFCKLAISAATSDRSLLN